MDFSRREYARRFCVLAEPDQAWLTPYGDLLYAPLQPGQRRRSVIPQAVVIRTHPNHTPKPKRGASE